MYSVNVLIVVREKGTLIVVGKVIRNALCN